MARLKFLEAAHVKDMLAVLRWARQSEESYQRISHAAAPAGMGRSTPNARIRTSKQRDMRGARCLFSRAR
jgi:hypothetical protein